MSAPAAEVVVRDARPDDVDTLVRFVHDLAAYEREPEACTLTASALHAALFGPAPRAFALVAEIGDGGDGGAGSVVAGTAIWFVTFSTWTGVHGLHLEDLWVDPAHRRHGIARTLLARLARHCRDHGYARLEWSVLDWNTPALDFYASVASTPMTGWTTHRVAGRALDELAARAG